MAPFKEDYKLKKQNVFFVNMSDQDFVYLYTRFLHRYQDDLAQALNFVSNKFVEINQWLTVDSSSDFHFRMDSLTDAFIAESRKRKIVDPILNLS